MSISDEIVIMDKWEADKIPSEFEVCDAYLQEIISCNVLENRSLDTQFKKDVLLIEDVEFSPTHESLSSSSGVLSSHFL